MSTTLKRFLCGFGGHVWTWSERRHREVCYKCGASRPRVDATAEAGARDETGPTAGSVEKRSDR